MTVSLILKVVKLRLPLFFIKGDGGLSGRKLNRAKVLETCFYPEKLSLISLNQTSILINLQKIEDILIKKK